MIYVQEKLDPPKTNINFAIVSIQHAIVLTLTFIFSNYCKEENKNKHFHLRYAAALLGHAHNYLLGGWVWFV